MDLCGNRYLRVCCRLVDAVGALVEFLAHEPVIGSLHNLFWAPIGEHVSVTLSVASELFGVVGHASDRVRFEKADTMALLCVAYRPQ